MKRTSSQAIIADTPLHVKRRRIPTKFTLPRERMTPILTQVGPMCTIISPLDSIAIQLSLIEGEVREPQTFLGSKQEVKDWFFGGFYSRTPIRAEVYEYVRDYGVSWEVDYPWTAQTARGWRNEPRRQKSKSCLRIAGYRMIERKDVEELIFKGIPVTAGIDTYGSLEYHKNGIYEGKMEGEIQEKGKEGERHAVTIVGYGEKKHGKNKGMKYFRIKNSWGTNWGKDGYGKVQDNLLSSFMYPILKRDT